MNILYKLPSKKALLLLFAWISLGVLHAQTPSTKSNKIKNDLKVLSDEFLYKNTENRKLTMHLAQQNQWQIEQTRSDGRTISLQGVDEFGNPIYYTTHGTASASQTTKTSSLYLGGGLGLNLNGSSASVVNKIGLWDSGRALTSHQELSGKVKTIEGVNYATDHATHLAGILVGRGINKIARGMAWGANLKTWDFSNDIYEMTLAAPDLLISNHSYGILSGWVFNPDRPSTNDDLKWEWWGDENVSTFEDYKFGFYDTKARDIDRIATLAPYFLIVKSADNKRSEVGPPLGTRHFIRNTNTTSTATRSTNGGFDTIPTDATAKNILTVGAVNEVLSASPKAKDILMTPFSSWGPTDDGRIKPDLMGMGVEITSSVASSNAAYNSYTGTSVAAPNVAGSLLLLQEYFAQVNNGKLMRSSTLKALAIHTATEAGIAPGPDYQFGWGLLNIEQAAKTIGNTTNNQIQEIVIGKGSTYCVNVTPTGKEPLVATLAWIDPEGNPQTTSLLDNRNPKLINDLDLRISDGTATSLPWVLNPADPSKAATVGDNILDNVEQVNVPVPVANKTYTISVGHKGILLNGSQAFSLIIGGINKVGCQMNIGVSPSGKQTLCRGQFLKLSASTGTNYTYQWLKDGVNIAGATSFSYFVSQAGSYQVKINQGSCSAISQSVIVEASSLTASVSGSGGTNICNGNTLKLSANTGTNYTYQWLKDGVNMLGVISSSINVTQTGNYAVRIQENECTVTSAVMKVTNGTLNATISPEGTVTMCGEGQVTLSSNTGSGYAYQWFRNGIAIANATSSSFRASVSGSYNVQITAGGCVDISSVTIVIIGGLKVDLLVSNTNLCLGNVTLTTNSGSGFRYQWYRDGNLISNATGLSLTVAQAGAYTVKTTNASNCFGISPVVPVTGGVSNDGISISPQSSTIFFAGSSVVLQLDSPKGVQSYQWYKDNVAIQGATSITYRANKSGAYRLVIGESTCASSSNILNVVVLNAFDAVISGKANLQFSKTELSINALGIWPNPASEYLSVEFSNPNDANTNEEAIATILSPMGVVIKTQSLRKIASGLYQDDISLQHIAEGRYFIKVSQGNQTLNKAFLKQ